jgi:hypothetical protein
VILNSNMDQECQDKKPFLVQFNDAIRKYNAIEAYHAKFLSKYAAELGSYALHMTALELELPKFAAIHDDLIAHDAVDVNKKTVILSRLSKTFRDSLDITGCRMDRYVNIFNVVDEKIYKYCRILDEYKTYLNNNLPEENIFQLIVKSDLLCSMNATTLKFLSFLTDVNAMRGEIASVVARVITAKIALPRIAEAA